MARDTQANGAFAGYAEPEQAAAVRAYAAFTALFNAGMAAGLAGGAARAAASLPERIGAGDVLLVGTATHKLSRLIAKDKITAFARAPFTESEQGRPGGGRGAARGEGMQRTIGELLVCPYCLGMWISGGFHLGLLFAPRATRFAPPC